MIEEKKSFLRKVWHKLSKSPKRFIKKYVSEKNSGKVAVYYHKFIDTDYRKHSNNQEVKAIIEVLNNQGYDVYLLDKHCNLIPKSIKRQKVDLFIGIDGCGGGKYYFSHLNSLNARRNFLVQTVQPPSLLRRRLEKRRIHREKNLKIFDDYTRKISLDEELIYKKNIHKVETLIFPNTTDEELNNELDSLNIKIKRVDMTTFSEVKSIKRKKLSNIEFLCISGSDPLRKGIDYAIEIFSELPYKLTILAPLPDKDIIDNLIAKYPESNNINYLGFLDIAGQEFTKLAEKSMFCINFSVSDSQPTAMLHAMKTGLIPIIDKDSGSFDYKYGLILDIMNESVDLIRQRIVNYVENLSWEEFQKQSKYISELITKNHNYEVYKKQFYDCL